MNVSSFIFQSPYSSMVQIGTPDPSAKKEESASQASAKPPQNTNETLQKAQEFKATQTKEVSPSVSNTFTLDLYT